MSDTSSVDVDAIDQALVDLIDLLDGAERDDLADRVRAGRVRAARPAAVVCVVGEFKQGKSSLVNELVGHAVCPVDDDIATAVITLVRYGAQPTAVVRSVVDGRPEAHEITLAEVPLYVTEQAAAGRVGRIDRVDVLVPSQTLSEGLVLVDTPGVGGMTGGHAAATLGFLPFADGLIFVTDLTSELTEPEIDFLRQAHERCPHVIVVETKSDLFPHWRHVHELNTGHLARLGLDLPLVTVSTVLAEAGHARNDARLLERSGYPQLITQLLEAVVAPAKAGALDRTVNEALSIIEMAAAGARSELDALDDPQALQALADKSAAVVAKLEQLRGPGSRWSVLLSDRLADLSNDINHGVRGALRDLNRTIDEAIETIRTAEQWEALSQQLQTGVSQAVSTAFVAAHDGQRQLREDLAELIAHDELVALPTAASSREPLDVMSLWRTRDANAKIGVGTSLRTGLTGLRGAQGGVMLLGMSGQFLPQAAAVFMLSNPVLLTVGAVFGGMQLFDERKRRIQARRQGARTQMRQFIDDVQFTLGNELGGLLRTMQRDLRDEFTNLITELQRTWTDAAKHAETARTASADERAQRRTVLTSLEQRSQAVRTTLQAALPRNS